jgi:hypothetical protein
LQHLSSSWAPARRFVFFVLSCDPLTLDLQLPEEYTKKVLKKMEEIGTKCSDQEHATPGTNVTFTIA